MRHVALCTRHSRLRVPQWLTKLAEVLGVVGAMFLFSQGCKPAVGPNEAALAYGAEIMACVQGAKTLQESRDCRRTVDCKWGVKNGPDCHR